MGATTDSEMCVKFDFENKPGISNLINIYTCLTGMSIKDIEEKYKDSNYGTFKRDVADIVVNTIMPIQKRYYELLNSNELNLILDDGMNKTNEIAKKKYQELKNIVGLRR